jgi:hypothetical protein
LDAIKLKKLLEFKNNYMKKLIVPIISCLMVFGMMSSCRKVDNPKLPSISRVPLPLLTDTLYPGDQLIPAGSGTFTRSVIVDVYFKEDVKPKSMDLVIVKNGAKTNYSAASIKTLKAGITTFPTTVTFTQADIQNLFGNVALGDIFEIGASVTAQDGTVYPAFTVGTFIPGTDTVNLAGGSPYGADIASLAGSSVELTYKSPCAFDASAFSGGYVVVKDGWNDYAVGAAIPSVVPGPAANQFTLTVYPATGVGINRKPMIMTIDTLNAGAGNASIPPTNIGDYPPGDPNMMTHTTGGDSFVDFCTGEITLDLDFGDANGDYGNYTLIISH